MFGDDGHEKPQQMSLEVIDAPHLVWVKRGQDPSLEVSGDYCWLHHVKVLHMERGKEEHRDDRKGQNILQSSSQIL